MYEGAAFSSSQPETPPGKPVGSCLSSQADISNEPETPPGKPVGSRHQASGLGLCFLTWPLQRAAFPSSLLPGHRLAAQIFASNEYQQQAAGAWLTKFLGRPADPAGVDHFAAELHAGATDEQAIDEILSSNEFFADAK